MKIKNKSIDMNINKNIMLKKVENWDVKLLLRSLVAGGNGIPLIRGIKSN